MKINFQAGKKNSMKKAGKAAAPSPVVIAPSPTGTAEKDEKVGEDGEQAADQDADEDFYVDYGPEEALKKWEALSSEGILGEVFPEGKHSARPPYTSLKTLKKDQTGYFTWEVLTSFGTINC